jgi:hypothetical protein
MPNKTTSTTENPDALGNRTPDVGQVCKINRSHKGIQTIRDMADKASTRPKCSKDFMKPTLTLRDGEVLKYVKAGNKIEGSFRLLSQISESI